MAKYVIVEESWEYNDEWYFQSESEGYNIKSKLYSEEDLDTAKVEVDRLNEECKNKDWFRSDAWGKDDEEMGSIIQPFKIVKIEE
jgi:hypothetical protein